MTKHANPKTEVTFFGGPEDGAVLKMLPPLPQHWLECGPDLRIPLSEDSAESRVVRKVYRYDFQRVGLKTVARFIEETLEEVSQTNEPT